MPITRAEFQLMIKSYADMQGVDASIKAVDTLSTSADVAGINHAKLHQGLRLISEAAGGALGPLGQLSHFLASPELIAGAGLLGIIEELNKSITVLGDRLAETA